MHCDRQQDPGFGQIPNALAMSHDGKTLYVACGGANAVAALDLPSGKVSGYLPAGWYPIAVAEREGRLFIASSKGYGSRHAQENGAFKVTGSVGTVQFIETRAIAAASRADPAGRAQQWLGQE